MERQQQNEQTVPTWGFGHCNGDGNCGEDECPEPWICNMCHTENDSILLQCINCPGRKYQANSTNNTVEEPPPALPTGHCNDDGNCGDCAPPWTCGFCFTVNKSTYLICDGICGGTRDQVEYVPKSTNTTSNGMGLLRPMANDYISGAAAADTSKTTNNSRSSNDTSTSVSFGMNSTTNSTTNKSTASINVRNPYKKKKTSTGSMSDEIDMTVEDDEDDGIYTDNEGGDEDRLEDGELVGADYEDEIYTKYSTSNPPTDTYAKCCGCNVPEDIAARSDIPLPTRCTLSKDELIKLHVGDYEQDSKKTSSTPINPSNNAEFNEALRLLSMKSDNIVWMPESPRCVECQAFAETLLVPTDDDRTGPRSGAHPNYWCFVHGRAYVKENGGDLVKCPSECECGRSRHGEDYPLCTQCYKAMKCRNEGCGEKVYAVGFKFCEEHDKAKGCSEKDCGEPRWRAGYAFCEEHKAKACSEKDCGKPRWTAGYAYAFCEEHDKAKGCNRCNKPRWKAGRAYCLDHDPEYDWCDKCGEKPRAPSNNYCEGCASLCKAPGCQAPLRNTGEKKYCGPSWCKAGHLGPEPTKKCAFCGGKKKKAQFHANEWKFAEDAVRKCLACKKKKI